MARVSIYLNFNRTTEAAFLFYREVFGGDFEGGIHRFFEIPSMPGQPSMPEEDRELVMHVCLPILGGFRIMGTDAPESMGFTVRHGNSVNLNLEPDSREEADRLFAALSAGGTVETPMQTMFWGAYFGSLTDRFGIRWMLNYMEHTTV